MTFQDLLRTVVGNLGRMRWRTVLTSSGVVIGTTAIILLVSLGVGFQRLAVGSMTKELGAATVITVFPYGRAGGPMAGPSAQAGASENKKNSKLDEKAVRRLKRLSHVQAVVPALEIPISELRYKRYAGPPFSIVGLSRGAEQVLNLKPARGRLSVAGKRVLLGAQVPKQFYDPRNSEPATNLNLLGERLEIIVGGEGGGGPMMAAPGPIGFGTETGGKKRRFRAKVGGILKAGGFESDFRIFTSKTQAERLAKVLPREQRREYSWVKVKVESPDKVAVVQKQVEEMGYSVTSLNDMLKGMNSVFVIIQAVLGGIASIALLVAAFGIANTMTMAIYERTREIGIMKAVGAAARDILRVFLAEAAAIGFLGGLVGVVFGWLLGKLVNIIIYAYYAEQMKDIPGGIIVTPFWLALFALIFATIVGLISGIYPASRAANLSPLGALRHD